jgi:hypothetical protein
MKVTVVTLADNKHALHFVAVVHGSVSPERRRELATAHEAVWPENGEDELTGAHYDEHAPWDPGDARFLYFVETETYDPIDDLEFRNIWG